MTPWRIAGLAWLVAIASAQAEPASLDVTITGVHSAAGHVLIAVCSRDTFLQETCQYRGSAPARQGSVVVRIVGLPPGVYAAQAYQDENDDHKINRSLFGIPTEGIGFSNDAPMRFGPPSFVDAAFSVGEAGGRIQFRLRYY